MKSLGMETNGMDAAKTKTLGFRGEQVEANMGILPGMVSFFTGLMDFLHPLGYCPHFHREFTGKTALKPNSMGKKLAFAACVSLPR